MRVRASNARMCVEVFFLGSGFSVVTDQGWSLVPCAKLLRRLAGQRRVPPPLGGPFKVTGGLFSAEVARLHSSFLVVNCAR